MFTLFYNMLKNINEFSTQIQIDQILKFTPQTTNRNISNKCISCLFIKKNKTQKSRETINILCLSNIVNTTTKNGFKYFCLHCC